MPDFVGWSGEGQDTQRTVDQMKILFLTTEDSTFWSHRLALARATRDSGAEVVIMTRLGDYCRRLEEEGFRIIPWTMSRRSLNPLRELHSLLQVMRIYKHERPDVVHHIALKPIAYGGAAVRFQRSIASVNSITGLGPVFIHSRPLMQVLRRFLTSSLKWVFGSSKCQVIFQNCDDQSLLVNEGVVLEKKTVVVPGFGVDTQLFAPLAEPGGTPIVILPARMLWEKGVKEFVEAAAALREQGTSVRMVLVGIPDSNNPGYIPEEQLKEWQLSGVVEWWGKRSDMAVVLSQAHVVCLPSYREGIPKVLMEATACARPIVATDVPGCSLVVHHGKNGLLVPARDSKSLASAIDTLLKDKELRRRMGAAGRERALREFSESHIAGQILHIYRQVLNQGKSSAFPVGVMRPGSLSLSEDEAGASPQESGS